MKLEGIKVRLGFFSKMVSFTLWRLKTDDSLKLQILLWEKKRKVKFQKKNSFAFAKCLYQTISDFNLIKLWCCLTINTKIQRHCLAFRNMRWICAKPWRNIIEIIIQIVSEIRYLGIHSVQPTCSEFQVMLSLIIYLK